MTPKQLELLRCPKDRTHLTEASKQLVEEINLAIRDGQVANMGGKPVDQFIEGGLVRAAGDILYPVIEQIPVLLHDEAISLDRFRRIAIPK
jgi:uncharacterized protein YbaR (Trm112 family)